jgi:fumarate reductase subunit D
LRLLVKRGLVVCDPPGLHLMDESFRLFVISVSSHQDVEGWRQQDGGSAWELMKAPLMLILVSVALFLFITQKDTYNSTLSFMSAITAGIAALFRLLGMFNAKDRGAGAIQN